MQFLLDIEDFPDFDRLAADFPTGIVVDHMGRPDPRLGVGAPGFQALVRALQGGRTWSKLSAPYRTSRMLFPYADMTPFARALVAGGAGAAVFGTRLAARHARLAHAERRRAHRPARGVGARMRATRQDPREQSGATLSLRMTQAPRRHVD